MKPASPILMTTKPKPQEKKFIDAYLQNGNNGVAAIDEAYPNNEYSYRYKGVKAHRLINSDKIREELNEISASKGVTPEVAMGILCDTLRDKKDKNRYKALIDWFEITGNKTPVKSEHKNVSEHKLDEESKADLHKAILESRQSTTEISTN
jgi:hypothetical protein